ncbi:unnamed protein product [Ranitomeya imitator]|uniref:Protein FAM78B n=1 Tax=Ranitomeya imitator TaxID=111125 RepID=A0ABN9MC89_9NEOB|nr:unnamed protein product [Ranitomeya imitator]
MPFATSFAIFQSCNVTGVTKSTRCAILRDMAKVLWTDEMRVALDGPEAGSVKGRALHSDLDTSKVEVGYWYGLVSSKMNLSSWELPDLREGRVKAISDSDGVSYPWYGNTTETVTLMGPTNKISRFSVSMNDNFYPSVTWAVPVSESNVPMLTRIKRDQSFTTWLVAMNANTKEKIILQTIKWRMRVDIEVDPTQLLGKRARLVGRTQQEQPRILSRMEPVPPNALVKPNANDAQVLMWRPKRGQPVIVIPPK